MEKLCGEFIKCIIMSISNEVLLFQKVDIYYFESFPLKTQEI